MAAGGLTCGVGRLPGAAAHGMAPAVPAPRLRPPGSLSPRPPRLLLCPPGRRSLRSMRWARCAWCTRCGPTCSPTAARQACGITLPCPGSARCAAGPDRGDCAAVASRGACARRCACCQRVAARHPVASPPGADRLRFLQNGQHWFDAGGRQERQRGVPVRGAGRGRRHTAGQAGMASSPSSAPLRSTCLCLRRRRRPQHEQVRSKHGGAAAGAGALARGHPAAAAAPRCCCDRHVSLLLGGGGGGGARALRPRRHLCTGMCLLGVPRGPCAALPPLPVHLHLRSWRPVTLYCWGS